MADRSSRPAPQPASHPGASRAADHRAAGEPPVGPGPDRVSAGDAPLHGAPGALPLRAGQAHLAGPCHRTGASAATNTRHPGDLVHVDIKKLGRIPDGGGHRASAGPQPAGQQQDRYGFEPPPGYAYLHNAVDDHSRLAYTEILADEKKETAAGFWERANAFFESCGITVKRVLTDNGSCYRSHAFTKTPWARTSSTNAPARTGLRPTARSNATTAPCSRNGPTPEPYRLRSRTRRRFRRPGSIPTITTEATPHSKVSHQPAASPTSLVTTASAHISGWRWSCALASGAAGHAPGCCPASCRTFRPLWRSLRWRGGSDGTARLAVLGASRSGLFQQSSTKEMTP